MDNKIQLVDGTVNILLIAPHGHPKNDTNTGELARKIANRINCFAVINEYYRRPYKDEKTKTTYKTNKKEGIVNLNSMKGIESAGMKDEYLVPIITIKNKILANGATKVFVIHIHGKEDDKDENKVVNNKKPFMLIGCGKGKPNRISADANIVENFSILVTGNKKHPIDSRIEKGGGYSGWSRDNLNQLFTGVSLPEYKDEKVQSIQIEIKYTGFRDKDNLDRTADTISSALREMAELSEGREHAEQLAQPPAVQSPINMDQSTTEQALLPKAEKKPDEALVEQAYSDLKEIFVKHYEMARNSAMLEAGRYIIKSFYGDDYKLAKSKKKAVKKKSLNRLIKKLQEQSNDAPNKTWIYNAVALAVDEEELGSFRTYGKLSVSHKLKLLTIEEINDKRMLVQEIVDKNLSVRDLSAKIRIIKGSEPDLVDLIKNPAKLFSEGHADRFYDESLADLKPEQRAAIKESISEEAKKLQRYLDQYETLLKKLNETGAD